MNEPPDHPHPLTPSAAAPPAAPPPVEPPASEIEDASARALAEALKSSFFFIKILMALLVVFFIGSGIFAVKSNEVAIVLRFGKPAGRGAEQLLKPGVHWAFPYPIDEIVRIPVGDSHTAISTVGWHTPAELEKPGQEPYAKPSLTPGVDGYTLTADGNIIHARATVKYRITDPWRYALHFASVSNLIENVLNNALYHASARYTAQVALYGDPSGFRDLVLARVKQGIEQFQIGISLEPSDVRVTAPLWVRSAFEAVQAAEQDRSKKINDAEGTAREIILRAEGAAKATINAGITWSNQLVQTVRADEAYFQHQLPYYQRDPRLFQQRMLTEKLERTLTNAQDKFYLPSRADGQRRELRIQLNREPRKPKDDAQSPR